MYAVPPPHPVDAINPRVAALVRLLSEAGGPRRPPGMPLGRPAQRGLGRMTSGPQFDAPRPAPEEMGGHPGVQGIRPELPPWPITVDYLHPDARRSQEGPAQLPTQLQTLMRALPAQTRSRRASNLDNLRARFLEMHLAGRVR